MELFLLLLVLFWAVVPGLIAGWMLHERGRRFWRGLLVGAVCGPLGILATLTFIYFSDRRAARTRKHGRGRAFRVFYDVPVVGRLHVSTVWALAGLATFLCAWMVGGIAYEVYGSGEPTILLLPSAPIVHSRQWKGQVPYLSRRHRVVTYDGRGNGASDRPTVIPSSPLAG